MGPPTFPGTILLLDGQLTEEERMVRDMAQRFGEDRLMPVILEWNRQEEFDRELMKEFGELGFLVVS